MRDTGAGPARTTSVIIGAGHAGLAMSRCLTDRSIDHVVLERGEVPTRGARSVSRTPTSVGADRTVAEAIDSVIETIRGRGDGLPAVTE